MEVVEEVKGTRMCGLIGQRSASEDDEEGRIVGWNGNVDEHS